VSVKAVPVWFDELGLGLAVKLRSGLVGCGVVRLFGFVMVRRGKVRFDEAAYVELRWV